MRFTELEEVGPSRKGLRNCPKCQRRSLYHADVDTRDIPAIRGAVVCTRTYECSTPDCGVLVRFYEVSAGIVRKKSTRAWRPHRDETGHESAAAAEVFPNKIVLKI